MIWLGVFGEGTWELALWLLRIMKMLIEKIGLGEMAVCENCVRNIAVECLRATVGAGCFEHAAL